MTIQCTICISNLTSNEAANAASCGHVFHEPCLLEWFRASKTCPQCRAKCDERQVRRLYFSNFGNNSTTDVDSLQSNLDEVMLEVTKLRTDLANKMKEIAKLRARQEMTRSTIDGLEAKWKLAKMELQNADSQIENYKAEVNRLKVVEKQLEEKTQAADNLEYIRRSVESSVADVAEILQPQPDLKTLATLVSMHKKELIKAKKNREEVSNHRRVCLEENQKLKKRIKQLTDKINTLESDNYKLQDDLSQMRRGNVPTSSTNAATISTSSPEAQSSRPATSSIQLSSATTPRNDSPYLNIRQSNVGLTPLLHRKRKPDTDPLVGPYSNLTIFTNPRKLSKTVQRPRQIYNGFGGSDRKENFDGFPSGQPR